MQNEEHLDCSTEHDCARIISKVFLALDNQLTPEEEEEFYQEINRCSYCLQHYNIEKSFKEFLCQKIKNHRIPQGMVDNIRSKIKAMAVN